MATALVAFRGLPGFGAGGTESRWSGEWHL